MSRIVVRRHGAGEQPRGPDEGTKPFEGRWDLGAPDQRKRRPRFSIRPVAAEGVRSRASWWSLAAWLALLAGTWAHLWIVVSAFEKMFVETGTCLPAMTEALIDVSHFARSPLGIAAWLLVFVGSIHVFRRKRGHRAARWVLSGLTLLAFVFLGASVLALLQPCFQTCHKL